MDRAEQLTPNKAPGDDEKFRGKQLQTSRTRPLPGPLHPSGTAGFAFLVLGVQALSGLTWGCHNQLWVRAL